MSEKLTLVIGGAASGKSAWAEAWVGNLGLPMVYLATSRVLDGETADKVASHVAQRGRGWETVECPDTLVASLWERQTGEAVLVDCATMWLTNRMMDDDPLDDEVERLINALRDCPADVTIVTNEVGQGIVPDNALARRFREAQGRLNIRLAQEPGRVVQVVAGLPNVLKGRI